MASFSKVFLVLIATAACGLGKSRVAVSGGDILLYEDPNKAIALTHSGRDFDPWLSPEHDVVLFVRASREDVFRTSVYEMELKTRREMEIFAGPIRTSQGEVGYLGEPSFDKGRRTLFVLAKTGVTTGELYAVDLRTRAARLVAPAASYDVILSGSFAGDLLLYQRKRSITGYVYYVYWLYTPEGGDLGMAGPDTLDIEPLVGPAEADGQAKGRPLAGSEPGGVAAAAALVQSVDRDAMAARRLVYVAPQYPAGAEHIKGVVELVITVSPQGDVIDVRLLSGNPALVQAAIAAVKKWRYRPFLVDGKAAAVSAIVDVKFPPS